MLNFAMKTDDRKKLVSRLRELTGQESRYLGMPSMAYAVGDYTVGKDGTLSVEEGKADAEVLRQLAEEGLTEAAEEPDREEAAGSEEKSRGACGDGRDDGGCEIIFSLPLENHTAGSLKNLLNLFYSRAEIVNRAAGSTFSVAEELKEKLVSLNAETAAPEDFFELLGQYEAEHGDTGLAGIGFDRERQTVRFSGFPAGADAEHVQAWERLLCAMNGQALAQKRIQAKHVDIRNEKYSFRCWLLRLGLGGTEHKETRKILMENLTGHAAFRTPEEAQRAKERLAERRKAQKNG